MSTQITPRRKSIKLTPAEQKALKSFRKTFHTDVECAEAIGIKRETLQRIFLLWSASPVSIGLVRLALPEEKQTA